MVLEVCIDRIDSALAAGRGGADRIEVCAALSVGGVTPSFGLVQQCVALDGLAVMMMIRPHEGSFCYDGDEVETMLRDVLAAQELGVQGVVIGALQTDRRIDRDVCQRLIEAARPLSITFHRAFDLVPCPFEALEVLLDLGVDRLLTSGQAACAPDGAPLIRELVTRCGSALSIMAGAGIGPGNVLSLVQATGVREVHASASRPEMGGTAGPTRLGETGRVTDARQVRSIVDILRTLDHAEG